MSEAATNKKTPIYKVLYFQVICAIVIGIVLGAVWPEVGEKMKPFGDGFIRLIKMIIAPVIFCTVVTGIAGMENMKKVGKTGGLALLYFEVVSTIALIIGLVIVNVVEPGSGMHVDPATLDQSAVSAYTGPGKMQTTTQFLMNVIPSTVVGAFAQGDILQVLFFSILFGFALHKFGGRGTLVFDLIEKSSQILFQIVGMIMRVAPIGVHSAQWRSPLVSTASHLCCRLQSSWAPFTPRVCSSFSLCSAPSAAFTVSPSCATSPTSRRSS